MAMNIVQFNEKFKKYMNDVRILEKTHPKQSIGLWLQVCQFIIGFAKSPNCPRALRKKLIVQADIIISKVKQFNQGNISSVFNATSTQPTKPTAKDSQSNIPFTPSGPPPEVVPISEDDMLSQLMSLPETPIEKEDQIIPEDKPDEITGKTTDTSPDITEIPPSSHGPSDIASDDLTKLQNLENILKKMPENLKEIKPLPFSSSSIIPGSQADNSQIDLDDYKKDTQTIDVTYSAPEISNDPPDLSNLNKPSEKNPNLSIAGFKSDPFKSSSTVPQNVPDPFGPKASSENEDLNFDSKKKICFACGAGFDEGDKICSQCGAELNN